MNKTNRIRTFFVLGAGILIGSYSLWNHSVLQKEKKAELQTKEIKEEQVAETSTKAETENEYVIINENGYLTVYKNDRKTIYFRTAISYEELNSELQKQIEDGFWIKNTQELYDFLENYSS